MFRRLPQTLPPDPLFPTDSLESLGYFVNEHDQIRQIKVPSNKFQYKINANDRVNQVYKWATNGEFGVFCSLDFYRKQGDFDVSRQCGLLMLIERDLLHSCDAQYHPGSPARVGSRDGAIAAGCRAN